MTKKQHPRLPLLHQTFVFWRAPVNWYILLLVAAFLSSNWAPLRQVFMKTHLPANTFGLFAASFSGSWVLLTYAAGATALLSSVPFVHPIHSLEILRMGQKRYVTLRLCHIALISLVYTLLLFVETWLLSGSAFQAIHRWGKVLNAIAAGNVPADLGIQLHIPLALTQKYTPLQAAGLSGLIFWTIMTSIGSMMFVLSNLVNHDVAVLLGALLTMLDLSVEQLGLGYRMYQFSPWSWARLDLLLDESNPYLLGYDGTLMQITIVFFITMLLALFSGLSHRTLQRWQDPRDQHE